MHALCQCGSAAVAGAGRGPLHGAVPSRCAVSTRLLGASQHRKCRGRRWHAHTARKRLGGSGIAVITVVMCSQCLSLVEQVV